MESIMRSLLKLGTVVVFATTFLFENPAIVSAQQTDEANELNKKVIELYNAGRYADAIPIAQQVLAIREKALGRDQPNVATSLNNLAELYRLQGRYGDAEPLYQRSSAIFEKALGRDHPYVANSLNNLAELYRSQGRYADAEPLHRRALAARSEPSQCRKLAEQSG
jgi:tetratricopeptide (TPR) repeat protein